GAGLLGLDGGVGGAVLGAHPLVVAVRRQAQQHDDDQHRQKDDGAPAGWSWTPNHVRSRRGRAALRRGGGLRRAVGGGDGDDVPIVDQFRFVAVVLPRLGHPQDDGDGARRANRRHAVLARLRRVPALLPTGAVEILDLQALNLRGDQAALLVHAGGLVVAGVLAVDDLDLVT